MKNTIKNNSTIKLVTSKVRHLLPLSIATSMLAASVTILAICNNGTYAGGGTVFTCFYTSNCSWTEYINEWTAQVSFYCCPDGSSYYTAPPISPPPSQPGPGWTEISDCCAPWNLNKINVKAAPTCQPAQ